MIISHKHKFIFFKTRKTAGTSIEIALSKFCGPEDIITPILDEDEEVRKELGYPGPQNCVVPCRHYSLHDWYQRIIHSKRPEFYNHIPARQVRQWVDSKVWGSYYKFCFERNPWDKAISQYYFYCQHNDLDLSFQDYLFNFDHKRLSNFNIYSIDGKVSVDHVALFENINQEILSLASTLGVKEEITLPRVKTGFRKDKRPYKDVISDTERTYIQNICQNEIKLLNYSY
jgi:hypothetical protein